MHTNLKLLLLFVFAVIATGCFKGNFHEDLPEIRVDVESVVVPAAIAEGSEHINAEIRVSSNRSWGINLVDRNGDQVDWVKASVTDNVNLAGMMQELSVILTFEPNWVVAARTADLILTTAECKKIIPLNQNAAMSNLEIDKEQTVSTFGPYDEQQTRIHFKTNSDWKVSVSEGATISDIKFSKDAGTAEDTYVDVTFGRPCAGGVKEAVVQFTVEGMDTPKTLTLVQTGLILDLDFSRQPFAEELPTSKTAIEDTEYTYSWYGSEYNFLLGKNEIQYRGADQCILLGKSNTIIGLPALEGLRLTQVELKSVATNKTYTIASDISGTAAEGGKKQKLPMGGTGVWELTDTKENVPYYIYTGSSNSRIASISLIYE